MGTPADVIASTVESLEQKLEAAYRAFERELEHEKELERAVEHAGGVPAVCYKVAFAVLLGLLVVITARWLGVI